MRFLSVTSSLSLVLLAAAAIAACGGGGGGGTSLQPPPLVQHTATPTPSPTPTPTVTPAACTTLGFARTMRAQVASRPIAVIPKRVGPGPASRVCQDTTAGHMHCMAWIRTDLAPAVGPFGYGPTELQTAYSLTSASTSNGTGQIVAIVDAFDDPKAEADLGVYRSTFALSACTTANGCFLKVNEFGFTLPLPSSDSTGGWESEESLDLDMVSAVCPNCKILLVEVLSNSASDLYSGVDTAAGMCRANVVSNSWGGGEYSTERSDEVHFNYPGVMITVAGGDRGFKDSSSGYPEASRYVTSVGGTTLNLGPRSETTWPGTGSYCSKYIAQPAWQTSLGVAYTSVCSNRITNDVSAVADPSTGVAVYDTFGGTGPSGCTSWCEFGGTSASAPIVGGVYAVAGNGATLVSGSYSYSHTGMLNDITAGSNGSCSSTYLCTAKVGFDGPTGNGTPNGIGAF
jgi:hypothetical protein